MGICGSKSAPKTATTGTDTTQNKVADNAADKGDAAAKEEPTGAVMAIDIYGVTVSMNCMGAIMLATQEKIGKLTPMMPSQTPGEGTLSQEFLNINPFHGVPAIKDGNMCLGESNTILRYMSGKYSKQLYLGLEKQRRAHIDWAMDKFASTMYVDVLACLYPVFGFREGPAKPDEAGKAATDNLQKFADVFLAEKFIGGKEISIADYKVAPFFFAYAHPKVKEISKVEIPERIKQFNFDFRAACPEGAKLLIEGDMSIKGFLDSKTENKAAMIEVTDGFKEANVLAAIGTSIVDFLSNLTTAGKDELKIYGVTVSMNVMGPVILQKHCKVGSMEVCMPGEQSQSPEYKAKFPYGGVPGLEDGKWCMSECGAILRYIAREYAEHLYPQDPAKRAHIDWAMDRFNFSMVNDCVSTIVVAMGFASAPDDLIAAGKKALSGLTEFADFFLKDKFVGGSELSIADFRIAPFFCAYAHPRVTDMFSMEIPDRILRFNKEFQDACPSAEMLHKDEAASGMSVMEFITSKTDEDAPATAENDALQKAMETEANKTVVDLKDSGPTVETTSAPEGCGCL